MDFQDRFRNRSSLLSKNGLHSILNAPGRPIRKSNTSQSTSFFVPNVHNVSTESITQRGAPVNPSNTSSENPRHIVSSRPALSHHETPLGKARKNIMPQSFFGPVQNKWFSNVGRYAEDNNETKLLEPSTHRIHALKTVEKDTETSYSRYKVSRPNEKSVNISKSRKEGDSRLGLGDYSHSQGLERIRTDKSYDDNEKIRGLDHIIKKSLRKTGLRGISLELVSSKKLAELGQPATVRMKEYIAQGGYFENKQILPQLDKVKNLVSFREKPHQSGGYLMDYFNNAADTRIEQKRSGARIIKTRSCDKGQKTMEKEQSEIKKAINREEKKENPNKLRKGLDVTIIERDISAESHKAAKRVSFRESAEVITNKTFKKNTRKSVFNIV